MSFITPRFGARDEISNPYGLARALGRPGYGRELAKSEFPPEYSLEDRYALEPGNMDLVRLTYKRDPDAPRKKPILASGEVVRVLEIAPHRGEAVDGIQVPPGATSDRVDKITYIDNTERTERTELVGHYTEGGWSNSMGERNKNGKLSKGTPFTKVEFLSPQKAIQQLVRQNIGLRKQVSDLQKQQ